MGFFDRLFGKWGGAKPEPPAAEPVAADTTAAENLKAQFRGLLHAARASNAEESCQRATILLDEISRGDHGPDGQMFVGEGYFQIGILSASARRKDAAEQAYHRALEIWTRLADADPLDGRFRGAMAECWNHLGMLYEGVGRLEEEAETAYRQAIAIREELAETHPTDVSNKLGWGGTLCNLGNVARQCGQGQAALDFYDRAQRVLESIIPAYSWDSADWQTAVNVMRPYGEHDWGYDVDMVMTSFLGRPHWILVAHHFLGNVEAGRAQVPHTPAPPRRPLPETTTDATGCTARSQATRFGVLDDGPGFTARTLFYPLAGYDVQAPVDLFLPWVDEFWFVDLVYGEWPLPHLRNYELIDCARETLLIHPDLVMSSDGHDPEADPGLDDSETRQDREFFVFKKRYRHIDPEGSQRIFTVHYCGGDAFAVFRKVFHPRPRSLSVFFYRGVTGPFRWVMQEGLQNILDVLEPHGLLVIDGCRSIAELDAPPFTPSRADNGMQVVHDARPFTFGAREIRCIGYVGEHQGPTLVWQVT